MHKKIYIPIIALLSVISFGNDAFSQKGKKGQAKRGAANRLAAKRNAAQKITPVKIQEQTPAPVTIAEETNPIDTQNIQAEIERLTAENNLLRNSINEKQSKIDNINSELDDLNEALANLEFKQNKSKSACTQMSLKKMDDIKGWLIATVAASGVGTAANATATITSFMQKDPSKVKKSDKKEEEKKTEDDIKENNDEITNEETNDTFEVQQELQKQDLEEFAKPEPIETNLSKKELEIKPLTAQTHAQTQTEEQTTPINHTIGRNPPDTNKEKTIIPEQPKSDKVNHTIGRYPEVDNAIKFEKKLLEEQEDTVDPLKHVNTDTKTTATAIVTNTAITKSTPSAKPKTQDTPKTVENPCYDANGNYKYGIRYENGMEISCLGGPTPSISKAEQKELDLMNSLLITSVEYGFPTSTTSSSSSSSKKEKEKKPSKWQLKKQAKEEQKKAKQSTTDDKQSICDSIRANKDNDINWKYNLMINGCNDSSYNTITQPVKTESVWTSSYRKLFVFAAENIDDKLEKKNQTLSTVSNISSIVGTVAAGTSTITATVVTGLISSMEKQVKSCKDTF